MSAAPDAPGRPLCIAHRGASASAPENTLVAFETAIRLGTDAIELDVHLTRDEVPVVLHDETLDRTTDGRGPVGVVSLAALQRLDAGSWFAPRFRRERVPTLAQALDCARGRCGMNIELKLPRGRGGGGAARRRDERAGAERLARAVAGALARARFAELLVLSSFSLEALRAARAVMPRARLGLLVSRGATGLRVAHRALALYSFHPHLRLASARRIRMARRMGLRVMVWPVNDRESIERFAGLEVDGVMTDDPSLFRHLALPPRTVRRGGAS